ncbi:hypothetical protein [Chryseobacterium sp.]|uniref:hypothetical protein n=1 Tax=Chryseobacterium sp. TaxID=1871047 RepID=UPI0028A0F151|nr:hypothetical protein [Chryseobacterium sp.]
MEATVLHNQSLLDFSIQHTGSVANAFVIAVANGFSVSDLITAGTSLQIPDTIQITSNILNYYKAKKIQPSTGLTVEQIEEIPTLKGIGYMVLSQTFKVDKNE